MSKAHKQKLAEHLAQEHGFGRFSANLREIIYGGNDGIVTTFAVVAGFSGAKMYESGAQIGGLVVLMFGLANLFADGTAMGLGSFLSARSEQDVYKAERAKELHEIKHNPQFERIEALEILALKGVKPEDAKKLVDVYESYPELMADFMMAYELGMADPFDGSPMMEGLMTFGSFLLFGIVPLLPYFFMPANAQSFQVSIGLTGLSLLGLGLVRWKITMQSIWRCVGETMLIGGVCAAIAYVVGMLFRL